MQKFNATRPKTLAKLNHFSEATHQQAILPHMLQYGIGFVTKYALNLVVMLGARTRTTDRPYIHLIHLFARPLSMRSSVRPAMRPSVHTFTRPSIRPSISPSICLLIRQFLNICISTRLAVRCGLCCNLSFAVIKKVLNCATKITQTD